MVWFYTKHALAGAATMIVIVAACLGAAAIVILPALIMTSLGYDAPAMFVVESIWVIALFGAFIGFVTAHDKMRRPT